MSRAKNTFQFTFMLPAVCIAALGVIIAANPFSGAAASHDVGEQASQANASPQIQHVILISVDGLRPEAILPPLVDLHPALKQFTQGAWTAQARCDPDISVTLPNHADMITGRLTAGEQGHGWVGNTDPPSRAMGGTLHAKREKYIYSIFDVAHDAGLQTALIAGKWKFALFEQSYGVDVGAVDTVAPDYGKDKVDCFICTHHPMDETLQQMAFLHSADGNKKRSFSFLHFGAPDAAGHGTGWDLADGSPYRQSLLVIDKAIGELISAINQSPTLNGRVAIVLTADHGGGVPFISHSDPEAAINFTIPFCVWSPTYQSPVDLYSINMNCRHQPAASERFTVGKLPPIRNADAANTCLKLLGLPAIPESTVNAAQELRLTKP